MTAAQPTLGPKAEEGAPRAPDPFLEVMEFARTRLKRAQDAWADVERNAIIEEVILDLDKTLAPTEGAA